MPNAKEAGAIFGALMAMMTGWRLAELTLPYVPFQGLLFDVVFLCVVITSARETRTLGCVRGFSAAELNKSKDLDCMLRPDMTPTCS